MSDQKSFPNTPNATSSPESAAGAWHFALPESPTTGPCGPEAVPARPSPPPGSSSGSKTPGICGLSSSSSLKSAGLQLSLANRLKRRFGTDGWIVYKETWREKATPSGRSYSAHTASAHRTSGSGSTGVLGWPTPSSLTRGAEHMRDCKNGQMKSETTGTSFGMNIETAAMMVPMSEAGFLLDGWPTPQTMDSLPPMEEEKRLNPPSRMGRAGSGNLREAVVYADPTIGETPPPSGAATEFTAPSPTLNPAFSRWLMGYPVEWCTAAIQAYRDMRTQPRKRGKCVSKAMETPSSRKSPLNLSAPSSAPSFLRADDLI